MTLATLSVPNAVDGTVPRPAILAATDLHKRFGGTHALRGIDFRLLAGEIVAVMGPSGSGKSTLLHCLAGILRPDTGSVTFDGQRIDDLGEAERSRLRRTAFGFVFQFGQLVPELTALENVALPLLLGNTRRHDAEGRAADSLAALGLLGLEHRRPGDMSGGQAQRVAVARALVTEPAVIFADEPTGSLDSLAGEQVMELLTAAVGSSGTGVVIVTHEPRVAAYAHREVIVRDGRASGPGAA
ncbi:MAG TPA: ABC transporter ATP-binding protein [Vitreimonas sp.]|nr:ABC transporter ATP-binding protein [Vitreimonas sp.]